MDNDSYVQHVARQSGSNFYYSFFVLPKPQRQAITAVYAFCREVDDAVDAPRGASPAQVLAGWRDELDRTYDGRPTLPLTHPLLEAIKRFQLNKAYFNGILDGVSMDLETTRYPTFEALSKYCYHVAGEVGLLCMEIFGYRSERLKTYAVKLGTAFQLTNILRDVASDAARGRIYLPQEDLARFGVEEDWILEKAGVIPAKAKSPPTPPFTKGGYGGIYSPVNDFMNDGKECESFKRLMTFEADRARDYYREASVLPTPDERPALRAAEIMGAIYASLLERIERQGYDVFKKPVRVPAPVKVALALKAWWESR